MSGDQSMMLRKQPTHIPELNTKQGNPLTAVLRILSLLKLWKNGFFSPQTKSKQGVGFPAGTHPFCLLLAEKVQEEIGRTVKAGSWATYEDRKKMPYTNAVLHEVQRFITLLPHVPRCTAVDTHFRGYFLPKVGICSLPAMQNPLQILHYHWRMVPLEEITGQSPKPSPEEFLYWAQSVS